MRRCLLAIAVSCFAFSFILPAGKAVAAEPALTEADADQAKALLTQYLDTLVKASQGQPRKPKPMDVSNKLTAVKKMIHPKTLELIGAQEKKQVVTNGLAVWHWAKADYWLRQYELDKEKPIEIGPMGTVLIQVKEKNWRVEEGGEDGEWEPTSYLLGRWQGKWYLVDKRRNETFTRDAIKMGYKGYFDMPKEEPKKEEAQPE